MAIPEQLGFGKTGWHGDSSVSLRSSLNSSSMKTLLNELKADHNAVLVKLDADTTNITDTNYVALLTVTSPDIVPTAASAHIAQGGSYTHGDDAVKMKQSNGLALLHELKTKHNALLAKLDADVGSPGAHAHDYVNAARTVTSVSAANADFGQGGSSTHGDAGVAVRRGLENRVALANELKAKHNLLVAKLDADTLQVSDYTATCTVAAANLV